MYKMISFATCCYRPQRSWGKVMFSQACVILFTGGSASVHAGIPPPPGADSTPPPEQTPREQTPPWEQTPPRTAPPGAEHAGRYGQRIGGTHPTGMQSCYWNRFKKLRCLSTRMGFCDPKKLRKENGNIL